MVIMVIMVSMVSMIIGVTIVIICHHHKSKIMVKRPVSRANIDWLLFIPRSS